jgi:hypothetical protein
MSLITTFSSATPLISPSSIVFTSNFWQFVLLSVTLRSKYADFPPQYICPKPALISCQFYAINGKYLSKSKEKENQILYSSTQISRFSLCFVFVTW